jgi:hypothetical protein
MFLIYSSIHKGLHEARKYILALMHIQINICVSGTFPRAACNVRKRKIAKAICLRRANKIHNIRAHARGRRADARGRRADARGRRAVASLSQFSAIERTDVMSLPNDL